MRVSPRSRLASARSDTLAVVLASDEILAAPLQGRPRRSVPDPQIAIGRSQQEPFRPAVSSLGANQRLRRAIMDENGGWRRGPICQSLHDGRSCEADITPVAYDPDWESGPRRIEVSFFVAPGNGEHAWQCLDYTCGDPVAFHLDGGEDGGHH